MIAGEMAADLGEDPADIMGYAIQDLNGDGVPELAIGFTPEYGAYLSSVYTGRGNAQAGLWGSRRWLYISAGWQLLL